jgi:hypothetical protein
MKKLLLLLALTAIQFTNAQSPAIEWSKCYGGTSDDRFGGLPIATSDGGYITIGQTTSNDGDIAGNHGNTDISVIKVNSLGTVQWQKCFGGSNYEYGTSIIQTTDGGYIFCGNTESNDGDVTGNHGYTDVWVVKLSATGIIQWQKCFGGTSSDLGFTMLQVSGGGYIFSGFTYSNDGDVSGNHGSNDGWVVKLNSSGNIIWQKCYGGGSNESIYQLRPTSDGGYIFVGDSKSNDLYLNGNHGGADAWVVKLDPSGNMQWQNLLGGTMDEQGIWVSQTSDYGFLLSIDTNSTDGQVTGNHGGRDGWLVKLNVSGTILWQKCFGGTGDDSLGLVEATADGGYFFGGSTSSIDGDITSNHGGRDIWMGKLNAGLTIQWQKSLGGSGDEYGGAEPLADGSYLAFGNTVSYYGDIVFNHGATDMFIIKMSSNLATENFESHIITTYPNPTKDFLHIDLEKEFSGSIYDITGKTLMNVNTKDVDVSSLSAGIYLLDITSEGKHYVSKIVKQ